MTLDDIGSVDEIFEYISRKTGLKYIKETKTNFACLINSEYYSNNKEKTHIQLIAKRFKEYIATCCANNPIERDAVRITYECYIKDNSDIRFYDLMQEDTTKVIKMINKDYKKVKKYLNAKRCENIERIFKK